MHTTEEKYTKYQTQVLMTMYEANPCPGIEELCQIASSLGTSKRRINRWFIRMRCKKKLEGVQVLREY